jgi:GT2 family glycosyltransferase
MHDFDPQGGNLIFLISLPRSGSTLLQRVLAGHPEVMTVAEPWLMLHPLYALRHEGLTAEYDAALARAALDDFLEVLPGGETAYLDGLRDFTGSLYARALQGAGKRFFLDKTPRYHHILPELRRVFPRAKFVFLLRNPLAVLASTLDTWFDGDPERLRDTSNHRDLLDAPRRMLDAITELGDDAIVVRYETLVQEPEYAVSALCARLGIAYDETMLDYGARPAPPGRWGDEIGIQRHSRPQATCCEPWKDTLADDTARAFAHEYLTTLGSETVTALGYDVHTLCAALDDAGTQTAVITVATSIAPRGIEKQQRAVASWQAQGLRVLSLNTPEEIEALRVHFPQVEFIRVARDGRALAGKPYVYLDDVLAALEGCAESDVVGIINSDIVLRAQDGFPAWLARQAHTGLVYASRVDIAAAEDADGCVYQRGFDGFFFPRAQIGRLPPSDFMIGVPWWDYWLPFACLRAGLTLQRLDSRVAFHLAHPTNYSPEVLKRFAQEFTTRCGDAPFLHLYRQCLDQRFGDAAFAVLSDAALDHLARHSRFLTRAGETPFNPPATASRPRVSAIVSTYASAAFIAGCLDNLIAQTIGASIEIIVIDAASPENEGEIVADYQRRYPQLAIRYQRTPERIGVYAAWNLAIGMARGDYLISASTNDRLRADACEILARALDEHSGAALVYGNSFLSKVPQQSFEDATLASLYLWPEYRYEDLLDRCMVGPHPMWRRRVHDEHGLFDESLRALGDQEFWLRLGARERLLALPDFTGIYFVSEHSLTGDADVAQYETDLVHAHYQWQHRYPQWAARAETRRLDAAADADALPALHVLLLIPPQAGLEAAADTLDDLGMQDCPGLRVTMFADQSAPDTALIRESGIAWRVYADAAQLPALLLEAARESAPGWLCLLDAGDRLTPCALRDALLHARRVPDWKMLYADADCFGADGARQAPRFKPDFNLNLLRATPYIGSCVLAEARAFVAVAGIATPGAWRGSDLALRIADHCGEKAVGHVARLLVHRSTHNEQAWPGVAGADYRHCVAAHLARRGVSAAVLDGKVPGTLQLRHDDAHLPAVSVIVSHSGGVAERRLALQSLLDKTRYPDYEVLLLDESAESAVLTGLNRTDRIRVIPVRGLAPGAALNRAAESARGEFILWLDGRCVALHADWLERMVRQATEDDVGMVGARLVSKARAVLDGGVVLGLGARAVGARVNVGLHLNTSGYLGRAQCAQDMSAVTTLCALVRRTVFETVSGFDAHITTGLYRDIDLCLRVTDSGARIVWTPAATLMYLGTDLDADRPPDSVDRIERENTQMLDRWFPRLAHDPFFNRNLSHVRSDCQIEIHTVSNWDPAVDTLPRVIGFGAGSPGSYQYRAVQPLAALDGAGRAQCILAPFPEKSAVPLPALADLERMQPSALLLHNTLHDEQLDALARYRRLSGATLIFGQDDLMFALPASNPFSKTLYRDVRKRLRRAIAGTDRLIVTSEPLAEALREYARDVVIVPNYLPRSVWGALGSRRRRSNKPRVGWAGATQHAGDLALLAEVVAATTHEVDWVFLGMCPEALRAHVREFHAPVSFAQYPAQLAALDLDLAVAPLEHHRFNEAKSNLRLLEYGALGWPVIASDIHPYRHAPVCRVPNTPSAWIRAIRERIHDLDALAGEGDALRQWVHTGWMLEDHLDEWLAALGAPRRRRAAA